MATFIHESLDSSGNTVKGRIEADSARTARAALKDLQLLAVAVEPATEAGTVRAGLFAPARVFSSSALAVWTRQLAGLVASELPLERALATLSDNTAKLEQSNLVRTIHAEVKSGSSFAKALAKHPREFSKVYCSVVGAGEESGNLGLVLERLADDLEVEQALKSKIITASVYPAIVSVVAVLIVVFLMAYVVPQVANVFASTSQQLPFLTVAMLAVSEFIRAWGLWLLLLVVLAGWGGRVMLRRPHLRLAFDAAWLRLPLLGKISRGYNTARFASTLALMSAAGVPILDGLQAATDTLSNESMRADALEAISLVRQGAPLHAALAKRDSFVGLLGVFTRMGEETGKLPSMLERAAKQVSQEVQRSALMLVSLLEPALIVVMGAVVTLIVLAVLMPIIQMNQWAG